MSSTKIVVLKLKKIIYTVVFVALSVILILLLMFMFSNKKEKISPTINYVPGIYTTSVMLENQPLTVEVIVDKNHINSIKLIDLDDTIPTLYPLLEDSLINIEEQLTNDIAIEALNVQSKYKYTSDLLLDAINKTLEKANKK